MMRATTRVRFGTRVVPGCTKDRTGKNFPAPPHHAPLKAAAGGGTQTPSSPKSQVPNPKSHLPMHDQSLPISTVESLPISETFVSIQGEGKLTGVPSWFVRVSGCNLRCVWCDTPYASWKPEGKTRTIADLLEEASGVKRRGVAHAVVTGGEPMMFAAIEALIAGLSREGIHVTVETAGTIFRDVAADLMSISPKLANSTPPEAVGGAWTARHESRRINTPALQQLLDRYADRQLKFVLADAREVREIDGVLSSLRGWKPEEVLLMPEGVSSPSRERTQALAALCVERGWRYCHRLHIEVYGNKRGT